MWRATASPARGTSWPPTESGLRCSRPSSRPRAFCTTACSSPWTQPRPREAICAAGSAAAMPGRPGNRGALGDDGVGTRVDDHPEPLLELRRVIALRDAYELATEAEAQLVAGDHARAAILFERACELAPDSHELLFWAGVSLAQMGDLERRRPARATGDRQTAKLDGNARQAPSRDRTRRRSADRATEQLAEPSRTDRATQIPQARRLTETTTTGAQPNYPVALSRSG